MKITVVRGKIHRYVHFDANNSTDPADPDGWSFGGGNLGIGTRSLPLVDEKITIIHELISLFRNAIYTTAQTSR